MIDTAEDAVACCCRIIRRDSAAEGLVSGKDRTANRSWWARNRRWLLWLLALYVLAMLVLYYLSPIPQNHPMTYQLF